MTTLSIITPMYNAQGTIARTARSLSVIAPEHRAQVQWLVVDDGSTDESVHVLRDAAGAIEPISLQLLTGAHAGVSAARNLALRRASGDWVFFLDADDQLLIDPVPVARSAGDHTAVAWSIEYHRAGRLLRRVRPRRIDPTRWADVLTALNPFQPSSLLLRRSELTEPFDVDIAFAEDWLYWARNHRIFDRLRLEPSVISAAVEVRSDSASGDLDRAGAHRAEVACRIQALLGNAITTVQRNNLELQKHIGGLLRRGGLPLGAWKLLPCNPTLYGKLCVYAVAALLGIRATPHR